VPYKFSEGKQRDQDQMRVSLEPFAHPSAIALINLASVTDGSELHRYADSSGTIKETVAVSNEVVEVSDDKAENEIIELQSFTAPLRLSREPAAREVAPRAQSQAKREGSCVALEMDYGPLYNCEECADNILGAELNLPEASASWTTKRSEPVENNDLEVDRGPPALSPIINENIHVPTTYNEASGRATEKQAIPEQMHNISVVDAELSRFVERIRMYGARFIVHFGSLLEPATVPSINELRDVVSSRETTDGILGLETLKAVQKLAKALEENFELEEAESLYRRAIVGFRELRLHRRSNESQQILDTQIRLGRLFCSQQRYKEAQYLLLSATPRLSPDLDHLKISVYGVLLDVYIQLDPVAKLDVVPWMQKLLERPLGITTTGLSNFLIEGIHVARVYYIDGCHKSAHSILKRVVAKLELLDDNGYGIDKLEGYLEYSCICQRMDIWDEASKYFQLAQGLLKRASGCEANAVQFVESRLSEISLRSRGAYESPWGESSSLYMASRRYDDYHGGSDGTLREDPLTEEALRKLRKCKDYERPRKGGSSKTDTGTSANGSLRYGVTYPGSESTGGAISEFLYL
jgi:tetratricopeptide (TPR) repeat protein